MGDNATDLKAGVNACPHCNGGCGCGWTHGYIGDYQPERQIRGSAFSKLYAEGAAARDRQRQVIGTALDDSTPLPDGSHRVDVSVGSLGLSLPTEPHLCPHGKRSFCGPCEVAIDRAVADRDAELRRLQAIALAAAEVSDEFGDDITERDAPVAFARLKALRDALDVAPGSATADVPGFMSLVDVDAAIGAIEATIIGDEIEFEDITSPEGARDCALETLRHVREALGVPAVDDGDPRTPEYGVGAPPGSIVLADMLDAHDPVSPGEMQLDPGIRRYVLILRSEGIETDQSCQGGPGHACPEPVVRFSGNAYEGMRAFAVAMTYGLPVLAIRHVWSVYDGDIHGPQWEIVFRTADPDAASLREPVAVLAEGMAARA